MPPIVFQECLRFLASKALNEDDLFTSPFDRNEVLILKETFESGHTPFRRGTGSEKVTAIAAANTLLLWLGSLPEPIFPSQLIPNLFHVVKNLEEDKLHCLIEELKETSASRSNRFSSLRAVFKAIDPCSVEILFPLFEFLHHYWINQHKDIQKRMLQQLSYTFAGLIFGTDDDMQDYENVACQATSMLIKYYKPIFTEPTRMNRFEQDSAKLAQKAQKVSNTVDIPNYSNDSPLLMHIYLERLYFSPGQEKIGQSTGSTNLRIRDTKPTHSFEDFLPEDIEGAIETLMSDTISTAFSRLTPAGEPTLVHEQNVDCYPGITNKECTDEDESTIASDISSFESDVAQTEIEITSAGVNSNSWRTNKELVALYSLGS